MYQAITSLASSLPGVQGNDIIDVQLIGHSRGASVIGLAMNELIDKGSSIPHLGDGYYELTFLDPHPANAQTVDDVSTGGLSALALLPYGEYLEIAVEIGYLVKSYLADDPPITVQQRVNQVQDFYQTNSTFSLTYTNALLKNSPWETVFNLQGDPNQIMADNGVTLVQTVNLSSLGFGHGEVPLWYLAYLSFLTNGSPPPNPPPPWPVPTSRSGGVIITALSSVDQLLVVPVSLEVASGSSTEEFTFWH